jgi:hypothetical protein
MEGIYVIKGIKACLINEGSCRDCPYKKMGPPVFSEDMGCFQYLARDAEGMLDRFTPKKPVEASDEKRRLGYVYECPTCHYALSHKKKPYAILPRFMREDDVLYWCQRFCVFCGQAIDWGM